jgi:hypothetical protein
MQPKQQGIVHFDSEPRGAQIIIDGQIIINPDTEESVRTPAKVSIFEGRHDFLLRIHGASATGYVDVYPGTTVNIFRNMEPGKSEEGLGQPEPQIWLGQNVGTIRIYSEPDGAEIYIDNNPVIDQSGNIVKTPVIITDVPDGIRQITFTMPGYLNEMTTVDVYQGAYSDVMARLKPDYPRYA